MNILIVSAVFPPEPVVSASISFHLAMELAKNNNVVVLCPQPTRPNGKVFELADFSGANFKVVQLQSYTCPQSNFVGRMRESISFGSETAKYIKSHVNEIDCIYANTWPIFAQYKTIKAAKHHAIPITVHIQDIYPESMLHRLGLVGKIAGHSLTLIDSFYLNKASLIITISDKMKSFLVQTRKLQSNNVEVVRNWQDEAAFSEIDTNHVNNEFTYMFVGSISPAAGVEFIIKAFIKANIQGAKLVIAGDGSRKKECQQIASESVVGLIDFISVSPETVPLVQEKADVLLLSLKKGVGVTASPSKLPAYMFSAKPILASVDANSDAEYVIEKSKCGFVCNAENENEFIALLKKIKNVSEHDRNSMGQNGRRYAFENMSKNNNLIKLVNLIK